MESKELPLWRVWRNGRWTLVRAADSDCVYRSFRADVRREITGVKQVRKTSEVLREESHAHA